MKCSYHPGIDAREPCSVCNKPLCPECVHTVKGKAYCQDCLVEGAMWASTVKGLKFPADAPRRAAWCAIIPGLGAVYNNEYIKAITYFAVFAALFVIGDIFTFGAFVFLAFTIFEAYRSAEARARKRIQTGNVPDESFGQDKAIIGWGIILIILGLIFLLQNLLPNFYLHRIWPFLFIILGAYLVYRSIQSKEKPGNLPADSLPGRKEDI